MTADPGTLERTVAAVPLTARDRDHRFFATMAVLAIVTVFVGFAPTYYLAPLFGSRPLRALVHLHGLLMTAWLVLFLVQVSLIATRRVAIHRRMGVAGATLAVAILVVGYMTAVTAAKLGVTPPGGPPPLAFLAVPLGTLTAFGVLVSLAVYYRRRPETHKRLMLLSTIAILAPALARMHFIGGGGPPVAIAGTTLYVLACMGYDRWAHGRIHPVFLWGGVLLILSLPARFALTRLEAWRTVAEWMVK
jgi:uncharacterized membrane protein YozB (DUF420 family)